jgi:hypothetical protein
MLKNVGGFVWLTVLIVATKTLPIQDLAVDVGSSFP